MNQQWYKNPKNSHDTLKQKLLLPKSKRDIFKIIGK